ncbi:DUF805 domain-containing protein [Rhizobium sp. TRM95111]|uniref:DUF805 domain-containing protein n=1 Tax=Rhizobium alarense TaxID=2846851 RepID=UPI001F40F03B|nr:DUF805 domain-containing protein [Rhizobium alarense]MCF3639169.1 DUF805 domain-containing protein [Rhizobium alarense]
MTAGEDRTPNLTWLFFGWSGRVGRSLYALAWLFWLMLVSAFLTQLVATPEGAPGFVWWSLGFFATAALSTVSSVMLTVKRLHDMNLPAALVLCLFVPAVSFFALLAFLVWPGSVGPNDHGAFTNRPKDWP